jgi:hypothetical protein
VNADGISFRGQDQVPQFVKQGRPEGQRVQDAITVQGLKEFTIVIEGHSSFKNSAPGERPEKGCRFIK